MSLSPAKFDFQGTARFAIQRRLGAGGVGVVYEALDRERNAIVALKTLQRIDPTAILWLKREFRGLQDIQHPNLVSLHELIEDGGEWFFTMELVDGVNFLDYVLTSKRAVAEAETISTDGAPIPSPRSGSESGEMDDTVSAAASGIKTPGWRNEDTLAVNPEAEHSQRDPSPGPQPTGALPATYHEPRLRSALGQLAKGLFALHRAGKVHRDIKPSNIIVTQAGRVVVLDFGLITETTAKQTGEAMVVGTAAYMAPEQAAGLAAGPAADWYAFGVVLYEALTGRLPLTGLTLGEILRKKQQHIPAPPRAWVPRVPADLDALAVDLLQIDPAKRPDGATILELLGVQPAHRHSASFSTSSSGSSSPGALFVGRQPELDTLRAAFDDTRNGSPVTVFVHGESGLGKSALIRHFARVTTQSLLGSQMEPLVLEGRCYERESVPFKAFDGVVDALAQHMVMLPTAQTMQLVPRDAPLLTRVFPVLGGVTEIARAPEPLRQTNDPLELRKRVFTVLRELFERLTRQQPTILLIDDFQWADADSLLLLNSLMNPPGAPPVLLLISTRAAVGAGGPRMEPPGDVRHISLEPLDAKRSSELVNLLIRQANLGADVNPETIAVEARGHPLYIDELVRHAGQGSGQPGTRLRLDEALWSRIERLEPPTLRLLELVAVAGAPLPQETIRHATGQDPLDFTKRLSTLRVGHLVRTGGARGTDVVEPYHDRVRESVLQHLDPQTAKETHVSLVKAIEQSGAFADWPELFVRHLEAAGDIRQATRYAREAADRAIRLLAFERAVELYRTALRLGEYTGEPLRQLRMALAEALAASGRGVEAADAYLSAAEGAEEAMRQHCHTRAAEQLLITGYIERGLETTRTMLADVGSALPATPGRALASLLWQRLKLGIRGMKWTQREESELDKRELARLDAFQAVGNGLAMVDPIQGAVFHARALQKALKMGEPTRIARSLSWEAIYAASEGGRGIKRARSLVDELKRIAGRGDVPLHRALAVSSDGIVNHLSGRFRAATELLREAETMFQELPAAPLLELNSVRLFRILALSPLGAFREQDMLYEEYLRDAQQRGDLYVSTSVKRHGILVWCARDQAAIGRQGLTATSWVPPSGGYHLQHWYELQADSELLLYEGGVLPRIDQLRPHFEALWGSLLTRVWLIRVVGRWLWARLLLRAAGEATDPTQHAALLAELDQLHKKVRGEKSGIAKVCAGFMEAAMAVQRGKLEVVPPMLRGLMEQAEVNDLPIASWVARRKLGELLGGVEGDQLIAKADAILLEEGVLNPPRMCEVYAPGMTRRSPTP